MARGGCGLITALALAAAAAGAAGAAPDAARVEVHPVPTVTIPALRVLAGDTSGAPALIAGELRLPAVDAQRVPAVVFLHGDAGAVSNQPLWTDLLNAAGIAVFTLDSFSGRGAVSSTPGIGPVAGSVGPLTRVADAYRALAVLQTHPRIDPARIALMGVSSGGRTALHVASRRIGGPFAGSGQPGFASVIALYPPCNVRFIGETALVPAPVRVYIGDADTVTRAGFCRQHVAALREAGADAEITVYAGARHGFDSGVGPGGGNPDMPNASGCELVETEPGRLVNAATGKAPAPDDACMTKGLSGGPDPAARSAVHQAVLAFLRRQFKLPSR